MRPARVAAAALAAALLAFSVLAWGQYPSRPVRLQQGL